jgi:hypothetical protein
MVQNGDELAATPFPIARICTCLQTPSGGQEMCDSDCLPRPDQPVGAPRNGCSVRSELGEQVADARNVQPGRGRLGDGLVAAGQSPPPTELGEAVLDLPQRPDGLEALGLGRAESTRATTGRSR